MNSSLVLSFASGVVSTAIINNSQPLRISLTAGGCIYTVTKLIMKEAGSATSLSLLANLVFDTAIVALGAYLLFSCSIPFKMFLVINILSDWVIFPCVAQILGNVGNAHPAFFT